MKHITLKVEGMTCSHCEQHVKRALEKVQGVKQVEVSYKDAKAKVVVEDNVDPLTLIKAVNKTMLYKASISEEVNNG